LKNLFAAALQRGFFYGKDLGMEWLGWAIVGAQIAFVIIYRYRFGTWPFKLNR